MIDSTKNDAKQMRIEATMLNFHPGAKQALLTCCMFPKRKSSSIPSIFVASWQCSPHPWMKIKHYGSNSHLLSCLHFCTSLKLEMCHTGYLCSPLDLSHLTYPPMTLSKQFFNFSNIISEPFTQFSEMALTSTKLRDSNNSLQVFSNPSPKILQPSLSITSSEDPISGKTLSNLSKFWSNYYSQLPELASFFWFKILWCFLGLEALSAPFLHCHR